MCEILYAEKCMLSSSLHDSLGDALNAEKPCVDVYLLEDQYLWFVVKNRQSGARYLRFPALADSQPNSASAEMNRPCEGGDSSGLLKALREASNTTLEACAAPLQCSHSVAGLSHLYTSDSHIALLLVLRCNCVAIASFSLSLTGCGSASLTAVRWLTSSLSRSPRRRRAAVGALFERVGRRFFLRAAFARAAGRAEFLELSWRGAAAALWRGLAGASGALGPLRLLEARNGGGAVRALRWMPRARDYAAERPMLAVLYEYAEMPGDPFIDRLVVCVVNVQPADSTLLPVAPEDKWAKRFDAICGSCVEGPWCLSALTLAHPSFLLQTTAVRKETSGVGKEEEVIGVFLRPPATVYPASAVLREWTDNESPEFRFALYTAEHGEIASCPVGGFVETAVYCSAFSRRRETDQLVTTVLAGKANGSILLIELWSRTNSREMIVIQTRSFAAWNLPLDGGWSHIYKTFELQWDGTKGYVSVLEARSIECSSRTYFRLAVVELAARGVAELQVTCQDEISSPSQSTCCFTSINRCWPTSTAFMSAGSLLHSFFQPLCRCDWADNDELVLTRSGDIWRIGFSKKGSIENCCHLSKVQRPSSATDMEALQVLFSSDAADVCAIRNESELLIVARDTAILMTLDGCISSTCSWGVPSSLYPCMISYFASYHDVHLYVFSATQALPEAYEGSRDCFFILLQLINFKGQDASPYTSMRVVDIYQTNLDGHPLFDWIPESLPASGCIMNSSEMMLHLREMVYYSRGILFSLPCAIVNSPTMPSVFQCRFGEPRSLLALQELLPTSSEPTLLKCCDVNENIGVIILSLVDGPALAVRIIGGRFWECQLIPCEAPLLRFVVEPKGKNVCGLLQDTTGCWRSLRFSESFDSSGGTLLPVELMFSFMRRALTNFKTLGATEGISLIVRKEGELFLLDSCDF